MAYVTLSVANGTLTFGGTAGLDFSSGTGTGDASMSFSGTAADINAALGELTYTPDGHFSGLDQVDVAVDDSTSAGAGTTARGVVPIDVGSGATSSDGPNVAAPDEESTDVDTALVFSVADENFIAVDDSAAPDTSLQVTLSVSNGVLTLAATDGIAFASGSSDGTATLTFTGTALAINAALDGLTYTPAADFNGDDTLDISVVDSTTVGTGPGTATASVDISVAYPPPDLTAPDDMTVAAGTTVTLTARATSEAGIASVASSFSYDGGDFVVDPTLTTLSVPYDFSTYGEYDVLVQVTDTDGQVSEDGFHVTVTEDAAAQLPRRGFAQSRAGRFGSHVHGGGRGRSGRAGHHQHLCGLGRDR